MLPTISNAGKQRCSQAYRLSSSCTLIFLITCRGARCNSACQDKHHQVAGCSQSASCDAGKALPSFLLRFILANGRLAEIVGYHFFHLTGLDWGSASQLKFVH